MTLSRTDAAATDDVGTFKAGNMIIVAVQHVVPILTINGVASVNEGSVYTLNLAAEVTGNHAIAKWFINWGDGSAIQTVKGNLPALTHLYKDGPKAFIVKASAADDVAIFKASNTIAVTVTNVAPILSISGAASVQQYVLYTLWLSLTDPGADTLSKWMINWGDGSPLQVVNGNPTSIVHIFAMASTFTVSATVIDEDGTFPAANTLKVDVTTVVADG